MATTRSLLFGVILILSSNVSLALPEGYCRDYAAQAVEQTRLRDQLHCSGGLAEWWNLEPEYHKKWCVSLPQGSPLPEAGLGSREEVLCGCRTTCASIVVHNNTDATLEVYVSGELSSSITTPVYTLPPVSKAEVFVQFGKTQLIATATKVSGLPRVVKPASVYKKGVYEIEIFTADFGVSFLADAPGAP